MAKQTRSVFGNCLKVVLFLLCLATATCHDPTVSTEDAKSHASLQERDIVPGPLEDKDVAIMIANVDEKSDNSKDPFKELTIVKRAPNGFIGMRGKKPQYETAVENNENSPLWRDEGAFLDDREWTAIAEESNVNGRRLKKASNAFYGVRGKKYGDYMQLEDFLYKLEEERKRELMLQEFLDRLAKATVNDNEIAKRAPIGFTGVRGKRPSYWESAEELEKRAPSNAFMGVRGKKDVSHLNIKRSPRESSSGRGKQQRFIDFSNKFVAVRGKKGDFTTHDNDEPHSENALERGNDEIETKDEGQTMRHRQTRYLMNLLPSLFYGQSEKRTPSGFLGMRGKRNSDEDGAVLTEWNVQ